MKKRWSIVLAGLLLCAPLAGCQTAATTPLPEAFSEMTFTAEERALLDKAMDIELGWTPEQVKAHLGITGENVPISSHIAETYTLHEGTLVSVDYWCVKEPTLWECIEVSFIADGQSVELKKSTE